MSRLTPVLSRPSFPPQPRPPLQPPMQPHPTLCLILSAQFDLSMGFIGGAAPGCLGWPLSSRSSTRHSEMLTWPRRPLGRGTSSGDCVYGGRRVSSELNHQQQCLDTQGLGSTPSGDCLNQRGG